MEAKKLSFALPYNADKVINTKYKKNPDTGKYEDGEGNSLLGITDSVIPSMQARPFKDTGETLGTRKANDLWGPEDPDTLKVVPGVAQPLNKQEYADWVDKSYVLGAARGSILHALIHAHMSGDPSAISEARAIMAENDILPSEFAWLDANTINKILKKTGSDYFSKLPDSQKIDRWHTEVVIASPILGWGGKADAIVDHSGDVYSLYDVKTG